MQAVFLINILITAMLAIYFSIVGGIKMLRFFMFLVVFQNIIVIVFSRYIPSSYNTLFSIIKELMLYISLVPGLIKHGKLKYSRKKTVGHIALFIYVLSLIKNTLVTPAKMSSTFLSLRYMLVPILCIYVGKTVKLTQNQMRQLVKEIVRWSLFLAVFGLIELLILSDGFWIVLGYSDYAVRMKGNQPWALINGVTINYYTWDFFGIPIRRLVSITADPLATAYLIHLGCMIIFTGVLSIKSKGKTNTKLMYFIILFIASCLSLSKAVIVLVAITILFCAYYYKWLPQGILKILTIFGSILAVVVLGNYLSSLTVASSISNHLLGLQKGLASSGLLGNGLGTAGSSVMMLTKANGNVAESYIGAMLSQLGLIGSVSFFFFIFFQIKEISKASYQKNTLSVLAICSLVGVFICMIFSESSVSIMGTGIYFIIIGIAQQKYFAKG